MTTPTLSLVINRESTCADVAPSNTSIGNLSGRKVEVSKEDSTAQKTQTTADTGFSVAPKTTHISEENDISILKEKRYKLIELLVRYPTILSEANRLKPVEDEMMQMDSYSLGTSYDMTCSAVDKLMEYARLDKDFISQYDLAELLDDINKCKKKQTLDVIPSNELFSIMKPFADHWEEIDGKQVPCFTRDALQRLSGDQDGFFQDEKATVEIDVGDDIKFLYTREKQERYMDSPTSPKVSTTASKELKDVLLNQEEIEIAKQQSIKLKINEEFGWELQIGGTKISMERAYIDKMEVDFFVNAANSNLLQGTGVCGAIFNGAGDKELTEACNSFEPLESGKPSFPGDAKMTPAYDLNGEVIIHAVGPCMVEHTEQKQTLGQATNLLDKLYENILHSADSYIDKLQSGEKPDETLWPSKCENSKDEILLQKIQNEKPISIANPLLSTGVFGFPQEMASKISLSSIIRYTINHKSKVNDIRLVVFPLQANANEIDSQHKEYIIESFNLKV